MESPVATELMKRLRALKKKLSKVGAIEDMDGNKRNKEQVALLATKGDIECCIRELEAFKSKLDSLNLLDGDGPSRETNNSDIESTASKKAQSKKEAVDEVKAAAPSDVRASKVVQLRVMASEGPDSTYQQVRDLILRVFFFTSTYAHTIPGEAVYPRLRCVGTYPELVGFTTVLERLPIRNARVLNR